MGLWAIFESVSYTLLDTALKPIESGLRATGYYDSPSSSSSNSCADEEKAKEREKNQRKEREAICSYAYTELQRIFEKYKLGKNICSSINFEEAKSLAGCGRVFSAANHTNFDSFENKLKYEFNISEEIQSKTNEINDTKTELEKLKQLRADICSHRSKFDV